MEILTKDNNFLKIWKKVIIGINLRIDTIYIINVLLFKYNFDTINSFLLIFFNYCIINKSFIVI